MNDAAERLDRVDVFELLRDRAASSSAVMADALWRNSGDVGVGGECGWLLGFIRGIFGTAVTGEEGGVTSVASLYLN